MAPVARAKSLLMLSDRNVSAADCGDYTELTVKCTTGMCRLNSIFVDNNQEVRATIVRSNSRTLLVPSYTRVMVRTMFAANEDGTLWVVSDPYYKRVCALSEYDMLRVITITETEDFNSETADLVEMQKAPAESLDKFHGWQFAPKFSRYPLFFSKSRTALLPSYYSRRNTVWDRVLSVSKSKLFNVVTMTSSRQCGVFVDGVVVLVPQAT